MKYVVEHSFGYSMVSMWQSLNAALVEPVDFIVQRDIFLDIVLALLESGRAKLASDGELWTGSSVGQVKVLRDSWPLTRDELEADLCLWFLAECPAGIVWVLDDGGLSWT